MSGRKLIPVGSGVTTNLILCTLPFSILSSVGLLLVAFPFKLHVDFSEFVKYELIEGKKPS